MGSANYSFDEASSRLGRSKRSVHEYVKKGFIKKRIENGKSALSKEDVDQLAVELGVDLPSMNRHTFLQMQSRLKKLEDEMGAVKHILELRDTPPLRPDPSTGLTLITAVQAYLHVQDKDLVWTPPFIEQWASILERLDEESLNLFAKVSNDTQVWSYFFKFCTALMDFCWVQDRKAPSIEWQLRAGRLDGARKRLREVVVTWVEMGKGTLPQQLAESLSSNREALISRVAKET